MEKTDTLVIGAGQAGIAASEHLTRAGIAHLVLERDRVAEKWRSWRWDSLVANGPAWHDRFPGLTYETDPEVFPGKEQVADYLAAYARQYDAPVRTGVAVTDVRRNPDGAGFIATTSAGAVLAERVVVATGAFQTPVIPQLVPDSAGITQMHSTAYRNPAALPQGGVLVVGAGSSGAQIADELNRAGRKVWLAVASHGRPPRRYRGRDYCWWLGVLNKWDLEAAPDTKHVTISVSGAYGGHSVDFRRFAAEGITLTGRATGFADGVMTFADGLRADLEKGDADYLSVLREADAWAVRNSVDLPTEPAAWIIPPDPVCVTDPIRALDLRSAGISTIIWATGFRRDFGWLQVDTFDADGKPRHQRGVAAEPGIYFLGLPWQARRGSSFIWGVWHDAKFVVDHIAKLRHYLSYTPA